MKNLSRFVTSRLRSIALVLLLLSPVASCGQVEGHGGNGETHFLRHCTATCGDGLTCVCGVCTLACDESAACNDRGAECLSSASACGQAELVCDASCRESPDCAALGPEYRCDEGRCRVGTRPAEPPRLCDGSQELRFAWSVTGGFLMTEAQFLEPYGRAYLIVDGTCRYFATYDGPTAGVRGGSLTAAQEAELMTASSWSSIPAFSLHRDESCPDAGSLRLSVPGASAACSCGCDPEAPAGLEAALDGARGLASEYFEGGTPLSGPMRVLAYPSDDGTSLPPSQPVFDWPFSWPIESIVSAEITDAGSRLIEDGSDLQILRELRAANAQANVGNGIIAIRDAMGARFNLLVRDELPQEVAAAVETFLRGPD